MVHESEPSEKQPAKAIGICLKNECEKGIWRNEKKNVRTEHNTHTRNAPKLKTSKLQNEQSNGKNENALSTI